MNKRRRAYKAYNWRKHRSNLFLEKTVCIDMRKMELLGVEDDD